ncbi:hypothetical protein B7C51_25055 (plasmid) [Paenibacillus larvae subsp. pulvifaciens]|uniref:Uncharacterized protein n=1 Tax=Paenibacillus larvae subsp. pulvifaciens TaxID=1477 RepID=A0A1V0V047_9BACL|nr:hypothetical protein [Paenibacillus larvae]ARF70743.1 hypothetical protein B7C51_25055 [Paenibacillus larvae subsp. pulvifaciens]
MKITKSYDTEEEYRGKKGWVNRKIGICVYLTCKNESEFINIHISGCPAEENGEYGEYSFTDSIAYFDIEDREDAAKFVKDAKAVLKR